MKTARLVVLGVAVAAGGVAALLAARSDPPAAPPAPVAQIDTVEILVAKVDIGMGQILTASDIQWQIWPTAAASPNFMRRTQMPEAIQQVTGAIARRRAGARGEAHQGRRLGLHGGDPAVRHARDFDRNLAR